MNTQSKTKPEVEIITTNSRERPPSTMEGKSQTTT